MVFVCEYCKVTDYDERSFQIHLDGKRHKKMSKSFEDRQSSAEKKVFVRGFCPGTTEPVIRDFFVQYGPVEKIKVFSNGKNCIVTFKEGGSAVSAVLNSKVACIGGRKLIIQQFQIRDQNFENRNPPEAKLNYHEIEDTIVPSTSTDVQILTLVEEIKVPIYEINKRVDIASVVEQYFQYWMRGCIIRPFGSTVTSLAMPGMDMDLFLDISRVSYWQLSTDSITKEIPGVPVVPTGQDIFRILLSGLKSHQDMCHIHPIPSARIPIIKFTHYPTMIQCDISFRNSLGVKNSQMIRMYLQLDPRIKPLIMFIRYWMKKFDLGGQGKISNYANINMVLFYLQQLEPPVIPSICKLREVCKEHDSVIVDGWDCTIPKDRSHLEPSSNTQTIFQLLQGYFHYYNKFNFSEYVICLVSGIVEHRNNFSKQGSDALPDCMNRYKDYISVNNELLRTANNFLMVVQDPFELNHNVTTCVGKGTYERFKWYCQDASLRCDQILAGIRHDGIKALLNLAAPVIMQQPIMFVPPANTAPKPQPTGTKRPFLQTVVDCKLTSQFSVPISDVHRIIGISQSKETDFHYMATMFRNALANGLKFECVEITVENEDEPPTKQLCKDNTSPKMSYKYHFKSHYATWASRKQGGKMLTTIPNDPLEKEALISEYIIQMEGKSCVQMKALLDFFAICTFQDDEGVPTMHILLKDYSSHGNIFKSATTFINSFFVHVINKTIQYMHSSKQ